ncbi:MAG: flippase-like domain-containing protein [Nanoarchaeota archaeon]
MKRWLSLVFGLLVIGILVYVLKDIDLYELYLIFTYLNPFWLSLAFIAMFLTFVIWALKLIYIFRPYIKGNFWFFLQAIFAGAFFATLTPDPGFSAEPVKAYFISEKYKKPKTKVFSYVLAEAFFRILALILLTFIAVFLVFVYLDISETLRIIFYAILVSITLGSAIAFYLIMKKSHFKIGVLFKRLHIFRFIKKRFKTADDFEKFINHHVRSFVNTFRKIVKDKKKAFIGISLSIVFWVLNFLVAYFLFLSFGREVNIFSIAVVFVMGSLVGSFSPVPGGIGITEGSMTLLYSALGVPFAFALVISFLQRIVYYLFSLVVGGICFINLKRSNNGGKFSLF